MRVIRYILVICAALGVLSEMPLGTSGKLKASRVRENVLLAKRDEQAIRCTEILEGYRPQDGEAYMCVSLLGDPMGVDDPNDEDLGDEDLAADGTGDEARRLKGLRNGFRKMARRFYRSVRRAVANGSQEMPLSPGQISAIKYVWQRIADKNDVKYQVELPATPADETGEVDENGNPIAADPEDGTAEAQGENLEQITGEATVDSDPATQPPVLTGAENEEDDAAAPAA